MNEAWAAIVAAIVTAGVTGSVTRGYTKSRIIKRMLDEADLAAKLPAKSPAQLAQQRHVSALVSAHVAAEREQHTMMLEKWRTIALAVAGVGSLIASIYYFNSGLVNNSDVVFFFLFVLLAFVSGAGLVERGEVIRRGKRYLTDYDAALTAGERDAGTPDAGSGASVMHSSGHGADGVAVPDALPGEAPAVPGEVREDPRT